MTGEQEAKMLQVISLVIPQNSIEPKWTEGF
jgi:hypothetical protein